MRAASRKRLLPIAAGAVALSALLAGCAGPSAAPTAGASGGQSAADAQKAIAGIQGVTNASVEVSKTLSGLNTHYMIVTHVTLADSATVPDPAKLIDQLVAVSWSVDANKPDNGVSITLKSTPQIDVGKTAEQSGWTSVSYATDTTDPDAPQFALFPARSVTAKLGAWPGKVPPPVNGLVAASG